MTAELRSQLTEAQLDPEAMEEKIATVHDKMKKRDGFILFGNQLYKPAFFHREVGLDLSTGAIHLGGVQLENPTYADLQEAGLLKTRHRVLTQARYTLPRPFLNLNDCLWET